MALAQHLVKRCFYAGIERRKKSLLGGNDSLASWKSQKNAAHLLRYRYWVWVPFVMIYHWPAMVMALSADFKSGGNKSVSIVKIRFFLKKIGNFHRIALPYILLGLSSTAASYVDRTKRFRQKKNHQTQLCSKGSAGQGPAGRHPAFSPCFALLVFAHTRHSSVQLLSFTASLTTWLFF